MKAHSQKVRRGRLAAAQRGAAARSMSQVQAHSLGAGNHTRLRIDGSNPLEGEAVRAAAHFSRGAWQLGGGQAAAAQPTAARSMAAQSTATGATPRVEIPLASALTPTSAASIHLPASRAERLPEMLRGDLEMAFAADLSAVRVHRDAAAAAAARRAGAFAFAAGSHLYFASGAWNPGSAEGRELIAHEVAHTLQQTGRRTTDGGVRVTEPLGGGGGIQRVEKGVPLPLPTSEPETELGDLGDLFGPMPDVIPGLDSGATDDVTRTIMDRIRWEAEDPETKKFSHLLAARIAVTSEEVLNGLDPLVATLLFDVLKITGHHSEALRIWKAQIGLMTTYYDADFYAALRADSEGEAGDFFWIGTFWTQHAYFEGARPEQFADTFRTFLLGVTRSIQSLGGDDPFAQRAPKTLKEARTSKAPMENEAFYMTVWAVYEADRIRRWMLSNAVAEIAGKGVRSHELTVSQRHQVALKVLEWVEKVEAGDPAAIGSDSPEVAHVLQNLVGPLRGVAETAVALTASFLGVERARARGEAVSPEIGDAGELVAEIGQREEFDGLHTTMSEQLSALFQLEGGKMPTGKDYSKAVRKAEKKLRSALYYAAEQPLIRVVKQVEKGTKTLDDPADQRLILLYGWLMILLPQLLSRLLEYPEDLEALDEELKTRFPDNDPGDHRVAHRLRVARWTADFGGAVGWEDLYEMGLEVVSAAQEGQTESQLALLGEWMEIPNVKIGELREDFEPSSLIPGWRPLTVGNLATFFEARFFWELKKQVDELVKNRFLDIKKALLSEAVDRTNKVAEPPRKYVVPNYDLALRGEDAGRIAQLIEAHPKTQAKVTELGDPMRLVSRGGGVYFWTFPPLASLTQDLQTYEVFGLLIAAWKNAEASAKAEAAEDAGGARPAEAPSPIPAQEEAGAEAEAPSPAPTQAGAETDAGEEAGAEASPAWFLWLLDLNQAMEWWLGLPKDQRPYAEEIRAARGELQDLLTAERDFAYDSAVESARAASIYERSALVGKYLRPLLSAYDRYSHFDDAPFGGVVYEIPDKALGWLSVIAARTFPTEEQNAHTAIAVLEVADLLLGRFGNTDRFDIAVGYRAVIDRARKHIAESPELVRRLLPEAQQTKTPAEQQTWIDTRLGQLESLLAHFDSIEADFQKQLGFGAKKKGEASLLFSVGHGFTIGQGEKFVIDGIEHELKGVAREFQYHPPVGGTPSVLIVDGEVVEEGDRYEGDSAEIILFQIRIGNAVEVVRYKDDDTLKELAHVVTMESIVRSMQNTAELIEGAAMLGLEVIELIPGAGQIAMGARIGASILAFLVGGEFDDILDQIYEKPKEAFEFFTEKLAGDEGLLAPESLWRFLLFGAPVFAALTNFRPARRPVVQRRKGVSAKLTRLTRNLGNIGGAFAGALARVQDAIQSPLRGLQHFILSRPVLVQVLRGLRAELHSLAMIDRDLFLGPLMKLDDLAGDLEELPKRLAGIAEMLDGIQLPDELIDTADLLDVLIEIIVSRMGAKAELGTRAVLGLLDAAGYKQRLLDSLAAEIEGFGFKPNQIWQDLRKDYIDDSLETAKGMVVDEVYGALHQVPFLRPYLGAKPGVTPFTSEADLEGFGDEEAEAYGLEGAEGARRAPAMGIGGGRVGGGGSPLDQRLRRSLEGSFGHDFRHVRLHTGGAGSAVAEPFGAEAITRGSHVFLRQGLSPAGGQGRKILHHELTHVLQQTGSRPLGRPHPTTPARGKSGVGLRYDPAREASAERVARDLEAGTAGVPTGERPTGQWPIDPGGPAEGLQPALRYQFLNDLFGYLTSFEDFKKMDETIIEKTRTVALDLELHETVEKLIKDLRALLGQDSIPRSTVAYSEPFDQVDSEIITRLKGALTGSAFRTTLVALAKDAQIEKKNRRKRKKRNTTPGPVERYLDIPAFERNLAAYIYSSTGIAVDFNLNSESYKHPESGKMRKRVVPADPLKKIKVSYLHMGEVGGTSPLWAKLVRNTWGTLKKSKEAQYRANVRTYLEIHGPLPGIFQARKFAFTDRAKDEIERVSLRVADLSPDDLPPKAYYLDTRAGSGEPTPLPNVGDIRLRLSTHTDARQRATDRDSHHLPQFLLLEYFSNKHKDHKPFPHKPLSLYKGMAQGTAVDVPKTFTPASGGAMSLEGLAASRGGKMPSLLISRTVHQSSDLHVHGEPDDDPSTGDQSSQGNAIHNRFRNLLGTKLTDSSPGLSASEKAEVLLDKNRGADLPGIDADEVQEAVYHAMRQTYKWIRGLMIDRLDSGLGDDERRYYANIAEQSTDTRVFRDGRSTPDYTVARSELVGAGGVLEKFVAHSETEMDKHGWTLP